jgi:hypothetical protein
MKSKKAGTAAGTGTGTKGTRWAAEARSRCNKLTDAEREELLAEAMRLIYAKPAQPVSARRR